MGHLVEDDRGHQRSEVDDVVAAERAVSQCKETYDQSDTTQYEHTGIDSRSIAGTPKVGATETHCSARRCAIDAKPAGGHGFQASLGNRLLATFADTESTRLDLTKSMFDFTKSVLQ